MRGLAVLVLCAGAAQAEGPPADYFTGVYQRVGRDSATPPGLVNDVVRLDPAPGGLALTVCGAGPGQTPFILAFDQIGDVTNLLWGGEGENELWCLYGNNGDNYPLLTCSSTNGRRVTLWPEPDTPCAP